MRGSSRGVIWLNDREAMAKLIRVFAGSDSYRFLSKCHVAKTEHME